MLIIEKFFSFLNFFFKGFIKSLSISIASYFSGIPKNISVMVPKPGPISKKISSDLGLMKPKMLLKTCLSVKKF